MEIFSALNGVDDDTAREDITETSTEDPAIIALPSQHARTVCYRIERYESTRSAPLPFTLAPGAACVMPTTFVRTAVYPGSKNALKQRGSARPLYDDINLHALIDHAPAGCKNHLNIATCSSCVSFTVLSATTPCRLTPEFGSPVPADLGAVVARNIHSPGNWSSLAAPR